MHLKECFVEDEKFEKVCLRYQTVAFYSWIRNITSFAFKTYFVDDSRFDKVCLWYQTVACPNSNSTVGYERLQVLHVKEHLVPDLEFPCHCLGSDQYHQNLINLRKENFVLLGGMVSRNV